MIARAGAANRQLDAPGLARASDRAPIATPPLLRASMFV